MKCYEFQEKKCSGCKIKECRYWINNKSSFNLDDEKVSLNVGGCLMNIPELLYNKFNTFF